MSISNRKTRRHAHVGLLGLLRGAERTLVNGKALKVEGTVYGRQELIDRVNRALGAGEANTSGPAAPVAPTTPPAGASQAFAS